MSHSKYASTPQTTNLARISRLILGPCADMMRGVLLKEVPATDLSRRVKSWMKSEKRNPLNKSQADLIFPPPSNIYGGNYSDLDISLLYTLLRNLTTLPAHSQGWGNNPDPTDRSVSANMERIRCIRNKHYGHAVEIGIPDADFQLECMNIRKIAEDVDICFGVSKYQQSVDFIKTEKMDPQQEIKWIKKLTILESLVSVVEQNAKEIQKLKNKKENTGFAMNIRAKIDTTEAALEKQELKIRNVFVQTRAIQRVLELLETNRFVLVKGNPGSGKTTIAMHVLTELQKKGMFPLQLFTVKELYGSVSSSSNVALFLDNLFGEFSVSNEVDNFKAKRHLIKAMWNNDNCQGNVLIITIRNDIYKEAVERINEELFLSNSSVDLSNGNFQMQSSEIVEMFTTYGLDKMITSNTMPDVIKLGNSLGIPQCCSLLKNNPIFSEDPQAFLKDPILSLENYIKQRLDRKESKMSVLIYILLCGGIVEESVLKTPSDRTRKEEALKMIGATESTLLKFQSSVSHYEDFLMDYDNIERKYKFSHSSVQESLFKCLVNYYPQEIIKSCDFTLLERLTTCKKLSWNSVVIVEDIFQNLINRLLEVLQGRSVTAFQTISRLHIWEDEKFVSKCKNNQNLLIGLKENTDSRGQTMIVHFCVSGNFSWFKYLLSSASEEQRYLSLNEACAHNQREIVDLLLSTNVRFNLKTCFYAVQSGNLDLLYRFTDNVDLTKRTLSNHFHWNFIECSLLEEICFFGQNHLIEPVLARYPQLIDVRDNQDGSALHFVAYAGDETIFKKLVQSGCELYRTSNSGSTVLSYACQNGKLNMVRYICDKYPDFLSSDYNNKTGMSPFHWTAQSGNIELYEYLIEKGVEQTIPGGQSTPLHEACRFGRLNMCKYLVKTYPHLRDVKDNDGESALHAAARGGNIDLLNFLLEKGFDVKTKTNNGKTVLHLCCKRGKLEMCKYLVNTYPNLLDVKDNNGRNALHYAAWGGYIDLLNFLLEKGFDVKSKTNDGETVLHRCCMIGKLEMCKYLVNTYPHLLDVKDNNGRNALHLAAFRGNIDLLIFLLEKGFDVKTKRNEGGIVLYISCINGELEMCKYLVNTYPHLLDVKDNNGGNALHAAAWGGNIDLLNFLLEKGFDVKTKRNDGFTVLHLCCMRGRLEMCKYLVNTYPHLLDVKDNNGGNVLHDAAWGGNLDLLNLLLEKGFDIETKTNDGGTVLLQCCINGNLEMCKYLVNTYPHLLDVKDNNGGNALHDAAWGGNIDLLNFLLEKGFDVKTKRNDGKTVLHLCCMRGKLEMCKYLVNTYPHLLDFKDNNGENALHDAAWAGNIDLLNFLLEKGFDIKSKRNDGKTVLHLCCMNGKLEMCKYLVNTYPHLLDVKDNNGENALHDAASGGNIDLLNILLEKGFDVKTKRNDGKTVLHLCCMRGKLEMCKYLVNTYPHLLDFKDNNGGNALHNAAWGGNIDLLNFLLEKGSDVETKRNNGKTVLHQCCMNGKLQMCKYLVNTYPHLLDVKDNNGENALHDAAWGGNIDLLNFLLEKGFDVKTKTNDGKTVLHQCCMNGELEMCKYLVNTYPHLLDVKDNNGGNALHDAAWAGNIDLLNFLLEKGLDVKTKRNDGKTVLHLCCMTGKLDMCRYLVNTYPHLLDVKDNNGGNALLAAAWGGNIDFLNFVVEKGFDIENKRNDGKTALHLCCMNGKLNMCKYLVNTYPHLLDVEDNNGRNALHDAARRGDIDLVTFLSKKCFKKDRKEK
ncbi:serine/threonine-protein phosphatase 6 regulatory ankyrin repeat subunit C-like [Saccostrea cucullata]|uniref:serine/threonine-protein phosphatase 6 regulatory ankyrin repeat subunit C-like n=1 Tax=Saccostrea cuccullata TaxID=36930 RepID=UPI002ED25F7D